MPKKLRSTRKKLMLQLLFLLLLGFTPCEAEQPLQGTELQEKEEEKDEKCI